MLVPIDRYSFFVNACLQNTFETCGDQYKENIDFVFLTSKNTNLGQAFRRAALKYSFRVLSAPPFQYILGTCAAN